MNQDKASNLKEFFSNKRNLAITIGAILVIVLIVVLANVNWGGRSESAEGTRLQRMAADFLADPEIAKERYENESVSFTAVPQSIDPDTGGIVFFISPGPDKDGNTDSRVVAFSANPDTEDDANITRGLNPDLPVTVKATVRDVRKNGYVLDITSVSGTFRKGYVIPTATEVTETPEEAPAPDSADESPDTAEETPSPSVTPSRSPKKSTGKKASVTPSAAPKNGLVSGRYYKDGKAQANYNGIVSSGGKNYMVYHGQTRSDFSGKYVLDGKTYQVKNGVVQ